MQSYKVDIKAAVNGFRPKSHEFNVVGRNRGDASKRAIDQLNRELLGLAPKVHRIRVTPAANSLA